MREMRFLHAQYNGSAGDSRFGSHRLATGQTCKLQHNKNGQMHQNVVPGPPSWTPQEMVRRGTYNAIKIPARFRIGASRSIEICDKVRIRAKSDLKQVEDSIHWTVPSTLAASNVLVRYVC
jgi:hypothetical protein